MIVTILAIAALLLLTAVAVFGYRAVIRGSGVPPPGGETEKCAVCRRSLPKGEMVERQIADVKVLHFCRDCIVRLASDVGIAN